MARPRPRRAGSLSGQLLARRQLRSVFRPAALDEAVGEADIIPLPVADMAGQMAQVAQRVAQPPKPSGPIDRTGRSISLRLDGERHKALQMASKATGLSQQQLVLAAIDLWLSARKDRRPQHPGTGA